MDLLMIVQPAGSRLNGCARRTVTDPAHCGCGRGWAPTGTGTVHRRLPTGLSTAGEEYGIGCDVASPAPAGGVRPGTRPGCGARAPVGRGRRLCTGAGDGSSQARDWAVRRKGSPGTGVFGFSSQCGRTRLTAVKACPYCGEDVRVDSRPGPWGSQRERPCRDRRCTVPIIAPGVDP